MSKDYHFDITPHIVKQLGEQLVSDEVTALLELIKNSYDADASFVSIEINTKGQFSSKDISYPEHKGFIIVEDDGFGMNEETIIKSWLVISYSQKRDFKKRKQKTPKGRTPLGDKGLGRLSTQRLADICEIFTNVENKDGTHLAFNWKDFEKEDRLSEVTIKSNKFPSKNRSGTTLVLTNLNHSEVWAGKNLEKFKGQVSQIISPYKNNRPFDVYISINGTSIDLEESNENLRELAFSRFKFEFMNSKIFISGKTKLYKFIGNQRDKYDMFLEPDNGAKFYSFLNNKYKHIKKSSNNPFFIEFEQEFDLTDIGGMEIIDGMLANPGEFNGQIDEFSFDNWLSRDEQIQNIFGNLSNYRAFAQNQAGIKLFRNGFAVKPFGIDGEDWMKLRDSQTSGKSFYPLRPANVIGYFSIDEGVNINLNDKTDREGLVSNAYSRNFFTIAFFIRDQINSYQENIRRTYNDFLRLYQTENNGIQTVTQAFKELKDTKKTSLELREPVKKSVAEVNKLITEQEKIVNEVNDNPLFASDEFKANVGKASKLLARLKIVQETLGKLELVITRTQALNEVVDILEPKIKILESQLSDFSELASLGINAEAVTHEFASIADKLAQKAHYYYEKLKKKELSESDNYVLLEYIKDTVNGLQVQLRHLDPTLKYHREKRESFYLSEFFERENPYYTNRYRKREIGFKLKISSDFQIKSNKGKLTQIIDNILINSEYWLKEKLTKESTYIPEISIVVDNPWIYVSDNGYGVPKSMENQIFEPFVTTKPKGEGRGLGLFITTQLLDSMNGLISLEPTRNKDGRKYIFAINLSNAIV